MSETLNRRDALKTFGVAMLGVGAIGTLGTNASAFVSMQPAARQRVLRLAHLTDIHVQPERKANEGMIKCLHHVQSLADKPQLIITGGDSVFDSFEADDARTTLQWELWRTILAAECSLPVLSVIGNHDIWGWHKPRSGTTGDEPNYGKKRATEMLRLSNRYYSVDHASGWHFVFLDSIQQPPEAGNGYRAFLDDEQFDWLQRDLAASADKPVMVISHPPIVSAAALLWSARDGNGDFVVRGSRVHQDGVRIKDLFAKHRNVKLCINGHLHHIDRVDYNGVSYCSNGAVSGNWWKGRHKDCDEGYAVIDLFNDGTFERQYLTYGWKATE